MAEQEDQIIIHWTLPARGDIYEHINFMLDVQKIPPHIVVRFIDRIFEKADTLKEVNNPGIGQREPLLIDRNLTYRYLVEGPYKILYHPTPGKIYIAAVFDTRKLPDKMIRQIDQAEREDWDQF